jgi:LuxR family transcriptional regulator, maltose regulon positive regulatory protein
MNPNHLPAALDKLLVTTKFAPPRIGSRYIVRKHLLEVLLRDRRCKLTLVSGSAGFGKTILLAQWRQELMKAGLQVAWLSLSPDEQLLPNFRAHLFAALNQLGVALEDEALLAGDDHASMDGVVAMLVNRLATLDDDVYLVLDDYHHVQDPAAHRLLQKLLDHNPGNLHLAIASRAVPPLSVARLRVMGQVAEVECNDLPFDLAETRSFLEQNVGGARFSVDELSQIHTLTNGWPASLQLLAITLKSRPESRATLHNLVWQSANLHTYLSQDVLERLPPELAGFMEAISICRRFNAALAEAITGNPQAASLLRVIEDENLLIVRAESEDRAPWYRFHPLFAEFLATRLERRGAQAVNALHRRASAWFVEKGLIVEAVRHASLSRDLAAAVAIIERSAPASWRMSYFGPLLHLLNSLPQETIVSHPRLLYLASLTLALTGRTAHAAGWVAQMQATTAAGTPQAAFRVALASAIIAFQRDDTARAIELLGSLRITDAQSTFERYMFMAVLGPSLAAAGRYSDAHRLFDEHPIAPEERNDDTAIMTEGCTQVMLLMEGKVAEAERVGAPIYARALATHGRGSMCTVFSGAVLADALYEMNRIDDARELLANRPHSLRMSSPQVMIPAIVCQARLDLLQDSAATALALLDRQLSYFRSLDLERGVAHVLAEQVRIHAGRGHAAKATEQAARLAEMAAPLTDADGFRAEIPILAGIAQARVDLLLGNHGAALQSLATARRLAARLGRGRMLVSIDVAAATALHAAGRSEESSQRLGEAIQLGWQLGLVRTFVDAGEPMYAQLMRLKDERKLDAPAQLYLDRLLGHFSEDRQRSPERADPGAKTPLTPRELQILGLVASGMSNKRIAATLDITLETVKWNLKNVFVKLGVSSRYDAMTWARQQGLIE